MTSKFLMLAFASHCFLLLHVATCLRARKISKGQTLNEERSSFWPFTSSHEQDAGEVEATSLSLWTTSNLQPHRPSVVEEPLSEMLQESAKNAASGMGCKAFGDGAGVRLMSTMNTSEVEDLGAHPYLWCATIAQGVVAECFNLNSNKACDDDPRTDHPGAIASRAHKVLQFLAGVAKEMSSDVKGTFLFHDQDLTLTSSTENEKALLEAGTPLLGFSVPKERTSLVPMPWTRNMAQGMSLADPDRRELASFARNLTYTVATADGLRSKQPVAFWRGSPTGFFNTPQTSFVGFSVRYDVVQVSHNSCPDLVDATMVEGVGRGARILYKGWMQEGSLVSLSQSEKVTPEDMTRNAVLLEMDGFGTSVGYFWKASSDTINVKLDAGIRDWYYQRLSEGKHFLSVDATQPGMLCDLMRGLKKDLANDDSLKEIAANIAERQKLMQSMTPKREARRLAKFFSRLWADQKDPQERHDALKEYLSGPELPWSDEDVVERDSRGVRPVDA